MFHDDNAKFLILMLDEAFDFVFNLFGKSTDFKMKRSFLQGNQKNLCFESVGVFFVVQPGKECRNHCPLFLF